MRLIRSAIAPALLSATFLCPPVSANEFETQQRSIGLSSEFNYKMLDHAEHVNTKQLLLLQAAAAGELPDTLTIGGSVTAIADYQETNSNSKFGYLMRHPTSANQIGETASEAVIHSAQLNFVGRVTDSITAYTEILYNPEQSFGTGTITDLNRNQLQFRKAYVLWGNLEEQPYYASLGKMDIPFGLNDTVSPFTNSTVWHSFAGLSYGATAGYYNNGLHVRAMAVQGGSQFRAANAPVEDTNVPSRLNNGAVDINYTTPTSFGDAMVGASYIHGSPYCQAYPVFHFNPCDENNPAYSAYGRVNLGPLMLLGEYAQTEGEWPGTQVPDPTNPLSVFEAEKVTSFGAGGRYNVNDINAVSFEFSRFHAGDEGAPWERQDQYVLGFSRFITPSVNVFAEAIHADGFVPLNFLSGGNFPDGSTWSESDATTDVGLVGIQATF